MTRLLLILSLLAFPASTAGAEELRFPPGLTQEVGDNLPPECRQYVARKGERPFRLEGWGYVKQVVGGIEYVDKSDYFGPMIILLHKSNGENLCEGEAVVAWLKTKEYPAGYNRQSVKVLRSGELVVYDNDRISTYTPAGEGFSFSSNNKGFSPMWGSAKRVPHANPAENALSMRSHLVGEWRYEWSVRGESGRNTLKIEGWGSPAEPEGWLVDSRGKKFKIGGPVYGAWAYVENDALFMGYVGTPIKYELRLTSPDVLDGTFTGPNSVSVFARFVRVKREQLGEKGSAAHTTEGVPNEK